MAAAVVVMALFRCMLPTWGVRPQVNGHLSHDTDHDIMNHTTHEQAGAMSVYMNTFKAFKKEGPVYIFAMGPMASGKSGQEKYMVENVSQKGKITSVPRFFLIDDYVENNPEYKEAVYNFLKKKLGESPTDEAIEKFVAEADGTVTNLFKDIYMKIRKEETPKFDEDLKKALEEKQNIVYEMTGNNPMDKKVRKAQETSGNAYTFVAAVNSVDFCKLLVRNMCRAESMTQAFMEDQDGPAPRLQISWSNADHFATVCNNIKENIAFMVDCVSGGGDRCAPDVYDRVEEICVFDNNGASLKVIGCIQHGDPEGISTTAKDALKLFQSPANINSCKGAAKCR